LQITLSRLRTYLGLLAGLIFTGLILITLLLVWDKQPGSPSPVASFVFVTVTPTAISLTPLSDPTPTAQPANPTPTPIDRPAPQPSLSLGQVMVLEYHLIGPEDNELQRTPAGFRRDLERLHTLGYTPANVIDLNRGFPDLPAGKKPVVLTFDDSDISQFRYLSDGSLDPDSAVGMLYAFHQQHPDTWPLKGTFYVLQDVDAPERILFGQPAWAEQKLRWLVKQGFEVGSHTISHFDLALGTAAEVQWQLAASQRQLEARLPGYDVRSLSVPFGSYPLDRTLLAAGLWAGEPYRYATTVMAWGGPAPSPYSPEFDPYHIPRIVVTEAQLDYWLSYFEQSPGRYYRSGGAGER